MRLGDAAFRYQDVSPNDTESVMTNIVIFLYHQTDSGAICWLLCFLRDLFLLTLLALKTYHLHGVQIFHYNMHFFFQKEPKKSLSMPEKAND